MKFANVKISTRLIATFAVLVSLILLLSAFMLKSMSTVQNKTSDITDRYMQGVLNMNTINAFALEMRAAEMKYAFISKDPAEREELVQAMNVYIGSVNKGLEDYQKVAVTERERQLFSDIHSSWVKMRDFHEHILQVVAQNRLDVAAEMFITDGRASREQMRAAVDRLYTITTEALAVTTSDVKHEFSISMLMLCIFSGIAVIFAVIAATLLIRYLLRAFHNAIAVSDRIASGNLMERVEGCELRNEVGQLLSALDRMQTSLANTVASVRENADGVASASEQIAKGNTDLSSRTEQQAAALEETASAMEELSATIQQNTGNAQNADRLAQDASRVANEGGDMVARVVSRMKEINDGSQKVVDIISLIDSIAFQTNLLALNASVEAARAGEQGRGFAVVASEVRNLAQRSADASREISTLITDSVGNIREGTQLASDAGDTMTNVVQSVNRLKDIMSEISAASYEQSQGVTQVGTAVTEMDQTTQQNAALVEESAAAAASLRDQAIALVETVRVFQLADNNQTLLKRPAPRTMSPTTTRKPAPIRSTRQDNNSDEWETF